MRAPVGEIATLTDGPFGSNLKTSHYVDEGPRVIRLQNIADGVFRDERAHIAIDHFERLAKHHVLPGDIVVASLGENPPRACLVPAWLGPALVKADCIRVRPADGVEPGYLMWILNSPPVRAQASTRVKGVGRPRLGLGGIRQLEIPLPPLNEQRRIVAAIEEHLSRLDAAGASIAAALRRLDALVGATLAAALDGGPSMSIGELGEVITGSTPSTSNAAFWGDGLPFVTPSDLRHGKAISGAEREITSAGAERARALPACSVLVTCIGATIGKSSLSRSACATNQQINAVIVDGERVLPEFLLASLSSPSGQRLIRDASSSTTMPILNKSKFKALQVPLPSLEEQRRIVQEVEERLSRIDAMRASIERAQRRSQTLRAAILERAFRGELVPQDPADEPAEALLARIREERGTMSARP